MKDLSEINSMIDMLWSYLKRFITWFWDFCIKWKIRIEVKGNRIVISCKMPTHCSEPHDRTYWRVVYNFIDESLVGVDSFRNSSQCQKYPCKQVQKIIHFRYLKGKGDYQIQKASEDDHEHWNDQSRRDQADRIATREDGCQVCQGGDQRRNRGGAELVSVLRTRPDEGSEFAWGWTLERNWAWDR